MMGIETRGSDGGRDNVVGVTVKVVRHFVLDLLAPETRCPHSKPKVSYDLAFKVRLNTGTASWISQSSFLRFLIEGRAGLRRCLAHDDLSRIFELASIS